jgi:uncharacterized membrane protein
MANATYKIRRPVLAMSELTATNGFTIGTGISASNLRFGKSLFTAISGGAGSAGSAIIAASGVAVTDMVFVTAGSTSACMILGGASCLVADTITVKFYNRGAVASVDAPLSFAWLALR